jgi:hypothetical protein
MTARPAWSTLGLAVLLAGCADRMADGVVTVPLAATSRNAGEIGRAFLIPRGAQTDVVVEVSGVPPQVTTRPVHLYTFLYDGRCDRLPAKPVHALTDRVLAQSRRAAGAAAPGGPFTISNTAPLSLEALRRVRHAIVIRTSPADGDVALFCGNIDAPDSSGAPATFRTASRKAYA